jgi:hypothetical protein
MAHDLPDRAALMRRSEAAFNLLQHDMLGEMASSLGHHGRLVEQAMAALKAFDAAPGKAEDRARLVRRAARAVWAFLVQREICGFRDNKDVVRQYGIPAEVLARLGAVEPD